MSDEEYVRERVAQLIAHRACHAAEHDPLNGRIHGWCMVCGLPWPCEYAGTPPATNEMTTEAREEAIRQLEEECGLLESLAPLINRRDIEMWADITAEPDDATISDCESIAIDNAKFQCRVQRILAREQAALEELRRNWKGK